MEVTNQTAVEFLEELLMNNIYISIETINEAKELEKQQIIDACAFGRYVHQDDRTEGEQYYNRKYGKAN